MEWQASVRALGWLQTFHISKESGFLCLTGEIRTLKLKKEVSVDTKLRISALCHLNWLKHCLILAWFKYAINLQCPQKKAILYFKEFWRVSCWNQLTYCSRGGQYCWLCLCFLWSMWTDPSLNYALKLFYMLRTAL